MTRTPAQMATNLVTSFGDADAMADALSENVMWWESPSAPPELMASVSVGRETIRANMGRVFRFLYDGSTTSIAVHHALSDGDMGVVRFTMTAKFANGGPYSNEYTVWVQIRDGEIVGVWEYVDAAMVLVQMQAAGHDLTALGIPAS